MPTVKYILSLDKYNRESFGNGTSEESDQPKHLSLSKGTKTL